MKIVLKEPIIVSKREVIKEERNVVQEVLLKIKEKGDKRKQVHSSINKLKEITSYKNR